MQTTANQHGEKSFAYIPVNEWRVSEVLHWARSTGHCTTAVETILMHEQIDGVVLLELSEDDIYNFRYRLNYRLTFSDVKKLWLSVRMLQQRHFAKSTNNRTPVGNISAMAMPTPNSSPMHRANVFQPVTLNSGTALSHMAKGVYTPELSSMPGGGFYNSSPPMSVDGRASNIPPEFFKTGISLGYSFLVTWITSFVMVIVHERVPDMKRYPPLPDIFLDNVPHIPWAFHMCEITGTLLFSIWSFVCIFHKYRMVLLRRFFALAGTVFLLRCVTMLITSLSVPGTHLQCNQNDYAVDDAHLTFIEALQLRITRAYIIWSGLGMSIQGVRTCGDYMFSGHTVALTLLNFFITEYTPRNLYFLHTLTWLLNMFGIFFILAAHEHYSIDVFVAFYITSRLFLYYHTLANNQALMSHDSTRTRIWFPMFSYFESSVDGIIPNEYDTVGSLLESLLEYVICIKDSFMLTARRFWVESPHINEITSKSMTFIPGSFISKQRNTSTSVLHSQDSRSAQHLQCDTQEDQDALNTDLASEKSTLIEGADLTTCRESASKSESHTAFKRTVGKKHI